MSLALVATSACATIPEVNYGADGASDASAPIGDSSVTDSAKPDAPIETDGGPVDRDSSADDANVADAPIDSPGDAVADSGCALVRSSGTVACDNCLKTSCCGVGNKCLANDECLAIVVCVRGCASSATPVACRADCRNQHPNGKTDFQDVATCVASACGASSCS